MTAAEPKPQPIRFRGRSFMAFALTPEPPIAGWLAELDRCIKGSAGFFVGRPVILDLAAVKLSGAAVAHLIAELASRDIRIMGIEGAEASEVGPDLPPLLKGGRAVAGADASELNGRKADAPPSPRPELAALMLDSPVRSGQTIVFPTGDVTVLGSVASGAEIIAGGSIHVYGTLRGRAMAGSMGNPQARIFCSRIDAELLSIGGYYQTAEDIDAKLRSRPAQAWLDGDMLRIAALD